MGKLKYPIGSRVNYPLKDKHPNERYFIVVGAERKADGWVYHLAAYNFNTTGFITLSHVPQKLIKQP